MTTIEAGSLLRGLSRDLRIAWTTRALLGGVLLAGVCAALGWPAADDRMAILWTATMLAAVAWGLLSAVSVRQVRSANQAAVFIANGRLDLAERQLVQSLQSFSIYGSAKLMACHNLAVVAHGRGDYAVAAELCGGVLRFARRLRGASHRMTRMLLADCHLYLNNPSAAGAAIDKLDVLDESLGLQERLMLLPIQVRFQTAAGRLEESVRSLPDKVRLAELLESPRAALVHALLAHACRSVQWSDSAAFLQRRSELYHDRSELVQRFPILTDLIGGPIPVARPASDAPVETHPGPIFPT